MLRNPDHDRMNRLLGNAGLPTLGTPGLMEALGFCVRDHEHFTQIITACEPPERSQMYAALRPHVHFELKPLDVYIAEAGQKAEREQLPVIGTDGSLRAFNVPEIITDPELAVAQAAAEGAVSKQHLWLVCRKCTKEAVFHGARKADAVDAARQAGWTYGLDHERQGRELCPECPATRVS